MTDVPDVGSSSQTTGTKRRRVDSGEDGSQTQGSTPDKYKELQFDDASIVLQCPTASFRVHRSILVAHSEVFRDMFTLAQSGNKEDGTGIPVVHVSDDAEKMYNLLSTMYFSTRPNPEDELYFSRLLDNLELSRKYGIETISDRCKETLRGLFPDKLQDYGRSYDRRNKFCSLSEPLLRCIALAKTHRLQSMLPTLYHSYCEGFNLWTPESCENWPADSSIAITLYSGRHNLIKLKRDFIDVHIRKYAENDSDDDEFHCGEDLAKTLINRFTKRPRGGFDWLDDLEMFDSEDDYLAANTTAGVETLCDDCRKAWREAQKKGMVEAWEKLPGCFYLDTWEELRKEEKGESSQNEETEDGAAASNGVADEAE